VRLGEPQFLVVHCYRFGAHSKGDDFRDPDEIKRHKQNDPLIIQAKRLPEKEVQEIEMEVRAELDKALSEALQDPEPDSIATMMHESYLEKVPQEETRL
jgi:2-oxoisovalerate dehydrogenase E1 component